MQVQGEVDEEQQELVQFDDEERQKWTGGRLELTTFLAAGKGLWITTASSAGDPATFSSAFASVLLGGGDVLILLAVATSMEQP